MPVMEIVRSKVKPENREAMLAARAPAIAAIRRKCPGLLKAYLTQIDKDTWVDIILWENRAQAEFAQKEAPGLPECAALFKHVGEILSFEHADVAATD